MVLQELLTDAFTKERGGRHGGKGHEFQRYWALCHLLKLDMEQEDYLLLVEFVEDVVVVNSEQNPTCIDLIQLKKKGESVNWTKASLINPPKDGLSILAKLFASKQVFADVEATIAFASNGAVSLELASGVNSTQLDEFSAEALSDELKAQLQNSLATQLGCQTADISLQSLRFIKSHLSLNDIESHALGKVASYFSEKFPDHNCRADIFCRALYYELAVKATNTQEAKSFQELSKARGISKSQFREMLTTALTRKAPAEVLEAMTTNLSNEGVSWAERKKIKEEARRYLIDKSSQGNAVLNALEAAVSTLSVSVPAEFTTSWQVAHWMYDQLCSSPEWTAAFSTLGKPYVLAVILFTLSQ